MKHCTAIDCDRIAWTKCLCTKHYFRNRDHGDPNHPVRQRVTGRVAHQTKHGLSGHPLYVCWNAAMGRCHKPNHPQYKNYGGRGIRVCERWHDPQQFVADLASSYQPGLTLDRIDNDGNYEPGNVRWVTVEVQLNNTRATARADHHRQRITDLHASGLSTREITKAIGLSDGRTRVLMDELGLANHRRRASKMNGVVGMIEAGMSNEEIMQALGCHRGSVVRHRRILRMARERDAK